MSVWTDFGFRESPYATTPIPATAEGERLLVGREAELRQLTTLLTSSTLHPAIEGDNGVGKTSLVSVAGYRLASNFSLGLTEEALIPLDKPYQLMASDDVTSFATRVLYDIANAFIEHGELLRRRGLVAPDTSDINQWLNSPIFRSTGGGISVLGSGIDASRGSEPNTSTGFTQTGFISTVTRWLREAFPTRQSGGFICVIDNLELLETSQAARSLLESMRDSVLDLHGIRWVVCGARGIMRTAASSPRLEGRLSEPLEIAPIGDSSATEVVARRIEVFRRDPEAQAPVGPLGFKHIYDILNRNLRNTLKFCEDFAIWLYNNQPDDRSDENYLNLLEVWLTEKADAYNEATRVGDRAWQLFDRIASVGGSVSPSDYREYDFNSLPAMRPHIKALEDANLLRSTVDDTDKRRKTITITPRGWLVRYARSGYHVPE